MKIEASPWARNSLTPEDRAEIAQTEPYGAVVLLLARHPHGPYSARISTHPLATSTNGSNTAIEAFRHALAKVPA